MNKIEIGRGCWHESIHIDGEDLLDSSVAKFKILLQLYNIIDKLDFNEWGLILSMITENSPDFEEVEKESFYNNYSKMYIKKDKEK